MIRMTANLIVHFFKVAAVIRMAIKVEILRNLNSVHLLKAPENGLPKCNNNYTQFSPTTDADSVSVDYYRESLQNV